MCGIVSPPCGGDPGALFGMGFVQLEVPAPLALLNTQTSLSSTPNEGEPQQKTSMLATWL